MKYPDVMVGWLFDVANSLDWRVSILDIIETERRYPGLIDDLGTEAWQRKIIRDQIEGMGRKDNEVDGLSE